MKLNKSIVVPWLTTLVVISILLSAEVGAADQGKTLLLSPSVTVTEVGQEFNLYIAIDTGLVDIYAYQVFLSIEPPLVSIDAVFETAEWLAAGNSFFLTKDTLLEGAPVVEVHAAFLDNPTPSVDGYLNIARIELTAHEAGSCSLKIVDFSVYQVSGGGFPMPGVMTSNASIVVGCPWVDIFEGDIDNSGGINVADLTFLVEYLFRGGPTPSPYMAADLNCSLGVDVADLTYIVDYLFGGGPPPCDHCDVYQR